MAVPCFVWTFHCARSDLRPSGSNSSASSRVEARDSSSSCSNGGLFAASQSTNTSQTDSSEPLMGSYLVPGAAKEARQVQEAYILESRATNRNAARRLHLAPTGSPSSSSLSASDAIGTGNGTPPTISRSSRDSLHSSHGTHTHSSAGSHAGEPWPQFSRTQTSGSSEEALLASEVYLVPKAKPQSMIRAVLMQHQQVRLLLIPLFLPPSSRAHAQQHAVVPNQLRRHGVA